MKQFSAKFEEHIEGTLFGVLNGFWGNRSLTIAARQQSR
jgi:hypothetical protein